MSMKLVVISLFAACATLTSCGSDSSDSKSDPAPEPNKSGQGGSGGDGTRKEAETTGARLSEGKYYLTAGTVEYLDNAGNKMDPQPIQITGEYTWTIDPQGAEQYVVSSTGSAKLSFQNNILMEVNCNGARDIYSFSLTSSNDVRELKPVQLGCPQGGVGTTARQMMINPLGKKSFVYTEAAQDGGARAIVMLTFTKD